MIEVTQIFTNFVVSDHVNLDISPIKTACVALEQHTTGCAKSNLGGWQSDDIRLDQDPYDVLLPPVLQMTKVCMEYAQLSTGYTLLNSWININRQGDFNSPHRHSSSSLSGIFYVQATSNSGRLVLLNPNTGIDSYIDPQQNKTRSNHVTQTIHSIDPTPGLLVMFPSWLTHYVEPNASDQERISIAFNLRVHE